MVDTTDKKSNKNNSSPIGLIRDVMHLFEGTDVSEIEIAQSGDDLRIRIARHVPNTHAVITAPAPMVVAQPAAAPAVTPAAKDNSPSVNAVLSPMVGTAYVASEPGAPPFVKVGDTVSAGQTVMIVEAMKMMNNIPAPRAGTITKIYVTDKQSVEYNQPLLEIA